MLSFYRARQGNDTLRYIVLGFHIGSGISKLHGNPDVFAAHEIEKKINVEAERMRQFVRFSVMQGDILYARIEPDHNVLELIGDHFSDRFRNDPFLIHDVKRGKAMAGYQGRWYIAGFSEEDVPDESEEEKEYQTLWRNGSVISPSEQRKIQTASETSCRCVTVNI